MQDLIVVLQALEPQRAYSILLFSILRPLGLTFGFVALSYAFGAALTLRMSIALAIGLPAAIAQVESLVALSETAGVGLLSLLALKEFAIGYAVGLLLSLPFYAFQYAGAITDNVRGESDGGLPDPMGGTLQTYGSLYLTIGFFAFFSLGGMALTVGLLWRSYSLYPVDGLLPGLSSETPRLAGMLILDTLIFALRVAAPLLAVLLTVEMGLSVAARLTRKMGLYDLAFPARNVSAILLLPATAWLVWRIAQELPSRAGEVLPLLERFLQP